MPDSCNSTKGDLNLSSTVVVNTRDNMLAVRSNFLLRIILHLKPVSVVSVFLHTRTILTCLGTSSVASFFSTFNEREGNSTQSLELNYRFIKTSSIMCESTENIQFSIMSVHSDQTNPQQLRILYMTCCCPSILTAPQVHDGDDITLTDEAISPSRSINLFISELVTTERG